MKGPREQMDQMTELVLIQEAVTVKQCRTVIFVLSKMQVFWLLFCTFNNKLMDQTFHCVWVYFIIAKTFSLLKLKIRLDIVWRI